MINKLYIDGGSSEVSEMDNLETLMPKTGVRKFIDYLFGVIGGVKKDANTVIAAKDCVKAKALVTVSGLPADAGTITISPISWNTGKLGSDVVFTVCEGIAASATAGATGVIGTLGATGLSGAAAAAIVGPAVAQAINAHTSLSGIVGATASDGLVTITASRAGALGNNIVVAENATNTAVTFAVGSTGIYIGTEGTETTWSL